MKFTLSWLKDHLETTASLDEICDKLNIIGLEVEGVTDPSEQLGDFVVAHVIEAVQHPNADKLRVCRVDFGAEKEVQVVCGAPNARTGMIGVFAASGTYIPGTDFTLKKAEIRGVESNGMLCSERELQISDEHDGIIELDIKHGVQIGKRFVEVMGLDDPVIEIAITPNRPDALGVRGVARDLAAAGLGKLKKDAAGYEKAGDYDCPVEIDLKFSPETAAACPVFGGRYIGGVRNGPSPAWMQQRLRAIGLRPINALVDVTNYVCYDRARPLHVYDADKLNGVIHARLGKKGEKFQALDGKAYEAGEDMTVIADANGVLGFGGVIGGEDTGCTQATTNVFVESAYFDTVRTAMTGRKTGIQSDARYRFERGIDPQSVEPGLDVATKLILAMCGGKPSRMRVAGTVPVRGLTIPFATSRVRALTGLDVKDSTIKSILKALGFGVDGKGGRVDVHVPSWRPDVNGAADLVEEVIRIVGIDTVPTTPLPRLSGVARAVMTDGQLRVRGARRLLAGRGLVEAVAWSFIKHEEAEHFGGGADALELANPISSEMSSMRPSLLPGLLAAAQRNQDRSIENPALFEVGQAYRGDGPDDQYTSAAAVRFATATLTGGGRNWNGPAKTVDVFDAKADAAAVLTSLGLDIAKVQVSRDAPAWFHPGRSGTFRLGPKLVLGHFGEFHPATLQFCGVKGPAVGFEIDLMALPAQRRKTRSKGALELSDLQPVRRDFAFVMDDDVLAGDVIRAALSADKKLINNVSVFDVFSGESVGVGKKSLAIEVTLQPRNETLTDEVIDQISGKIITQVKKATGGEIRG